MRLLRPSINAVSIFILITITLIAPALSQSGRGRPKVPQPSSTTTASPPKPINVPATAAVIKQEQTGTTSRFVLRNGLTIVISEQHSTPIAAAVAYFKAGANDYPWSMSGAAQLLERLILKGTVLRPGERSIADLRGLGASIESGTSYGGTVYSVVSPSDKLKDALAIQADVLQNPSLDAQILAREIPFLEQKTRAGGPDQSRFSFHSGAFTARTFTARASGQGLSRPERFDDPAAFSIASLFNIAFANASSVNMEDLRSLTREQIVEFYKTHYRPENLIIAVVGDVSTFNTLVEIQQLYGDFGVTPAALEQNRQPDASKTKTPLRSAASPPATPSQIAKPVAPTTEKPSSARPWSSVPQDKLRYRADRGDITQSIISVGFNVPGAESADAPALEVLTALAGQGRASRLSRSLIDGQAVANRVEANYLGLAGAGLLAIQGWSATNLREGSSIDKVESALFKDLDRLRRVPATEGEMARARSILEKKFIDETTIYLGRANAVARAEASGAGFRAVLDYRSRIRAVSAQDVQRVAARYLTLNNTSIHEFEPFSAAQRTFDADTFAKTVTAWSPGYSQPVESTTPSPADDGSLLAPVPQGSERSPERQAVVESIEPVPVKDFSTLNGARAFVREDHAQQAVSIAILFQGGRLVEEATTSGSTELMLRSILYGTPRRTASQITQELEQLGADVRIVVEPDFFGFMLSVLSRNSDRALKLLRDMIEEPAFREDDVARARLAQITSIRDARDSSLSRSRELLLQTLFAGHPYSLPPHGREEVVAALTAEKLTEWHARAIKRQLPVAIIVGDTDGSALISSQLAEGFKRRDVDASIQVRSPQAAPSGEKTEQRRSDQTAITIGFAGPKAESADVAAVELIESAMNGQGGRLLRELHDKQALISMGWVEDHVMFLGGVISLSAVTRPESEAQTRSALLIELERLARNGLPPEELASARAFATTLRIALLQSQPQHALEYARAIFYRRQAADVDNFAELMSKVTGEDIKRIAAAYLRVSAASATVVRGTPQQPPASPSKQD